MSDGEFASLVKNSTAISQISSHLPAADLYVEIKGFLWKDPSKEIDDELKLRLVIEQNPQLRLVILMQDELKMLGII